MEKRFLLNNDGTKWVSIGIKPTMEGVFCSVLRLVDINGFTTFTKKEVPKLLSTAVKLVSISVESDDDDKHDEGIIKVKKTEFDEKTYEIENESNKIILDFSSLQRLSQLEFILHFYYRRLNDLYARCIFLKLVNEFTEEYAKQHKIDDDDVRTFLFDKIKLYFHDEERFFDHEIVLDTLIKFEDYFKFMCENPKRIQWSHLFSC